MQQKSPAGSKPGMSWLRGVCLKPQGRLMGISSRLTAGKQRTVNLRACLVEGGLLFMSYSAGEGPDRLKITPGTH